MRSRRLDSPTDHETWSTRGLPSSGGAGPSALNTVGSTPLWITRDRGQARIGDMFSFAKWLWKTVTSTSVLSLAMNACFFRRNRDSSSSSRSSIRCTSFTPHPF